MNAVNRVVKIRFPSQEEVCLLKLGWKRALNTMGECIGWRHPSYPSTRIFSLESAKAIPFHKLFPSSGIRFKV